MLHRAIVGSLERFIGILIEQHAGALPVWLAPVAGQRADDHRRPGRLRPEVAKTLQNKDLRGDGFAERENYV